MKRKTKYQLNIIFCLGLITSALSIGRAITITERTLTEDATCKDLVYSTSVVFVDRHIGNMVPSYFLSSFECKLGIIFACGPALRQFLSYWKRTHSTLPTKQAQYPNQDFVKMRYRINLRDIFWFRQAPMSDSRVSDAHSIFQRNAKGPPDPSSRKAKTSILDAWERRLRSLFGMRQHEQVGCAVTDFVSSYPSNSMIASAFTVARRS